MSSIANSLEVTLPTATSIVDNMVKKGLVIRSDDPEDRRLVMCALSQQGREIVNHLWSLGQSQIETLLQGLSLDQLKKAVEVAEFIFSNIKSKSKDSH